MIELREPRQIFFDTLSTGGMAEDRDSITPALLFILLAEPIGSDPREEP